MIEKALYQTVNPVLEAHPLSAIAEQTESGQLKPVVLPLAMYSESIEPVRTKEGISHYRGEFFVSVVAKTKLEVRTFSLQIIAAIEGMAGTTVDNTEFLHVRQAGPLAMDYDGEDQAYYSELTFQFKSKNI